MNPTRTTRARPRACLALLLAAALPAQAATLPSSPTSAIAAERLAEILAGDDPRDVAELEAMQRHVQGLLQKVLPATVSLPGASGVLVRREGKTFMLCAAHVTQTAEKRIDIRLTSGRQLRGTSLGANHRSDVSLVRVDTEGDHPAVEIGNSARLQRGEWVLMLGHPSGRKEGRSAPARLGRVMRVPESGYVVTDCTMQAGDSGGPLFDMKGRVVGINSRISRDLAMNLHAPVDELVAQWQELREGAVTQARRSDRRGTPRAGFGVPLDFGEGCPVFGEVPAGSAAAVAGLQAGDRLFEIDGVEIDGRRSLWRALRNRRPGDKVKVVIERDLKGLELTLPILGEEGR